MKQKKAKILAKRDKRSASFGFDKWGLSNPFKEQFANYINNMIREALEIATNEYECMAWFSIKSIDPTVITVELPLGETELEGPIWSFSLSELVTREIELNESGYGGPIEGNDSRKPLTLLRDSLVSLADKLTEALNRK